MPRADGSRHRSRSRGPTARPRESGVARRHSSSTPVSHATTVSGRKPRRDRRLLIRKRSRGPGQRPPSHQLTVRRLGSAAAIVAQTGPRARKSRRRRAGVGLPGKEPQDGKPIVALAIHPHIVRRRTETGVDPVGQARSHRRARRGRHGSYRQLSARGDGRPSRAPRDVRSVRPSSRRRIVASARRSTESGSESESIASAGTRRRRDL